jgi:hypothetical protein
MAVSSLIGGTNMKNIEYEKNGIRKMAQERFKDALIAEGWVIVEVKEVKKDPVKKKVKK